MVFDKFNSNRQSYDRDRGERRFETVKGNWECAECKGAITELPFPPSPDRPVYCKNCWAARNPKRFDRR